MHSPEEPPMRASPTVKSEQLGGKVEFCHPTVVRFYDRPKLTTGWRRHDCTGWETLTISQTVSFSALRLTVQCLP
jgi:hypothetical protein